MSGHFQRPKKRKSNSNNFTIHPANSVNSFAHSPSNIQTDLEIYLWCKDSTVRTHIRHVSGQNLQTSRSTLHLTRLSEIYSELTTAIEALKKEGPADQLLIDRIAAKGLALFNALFDERTRDFIREALNSSEEGCPSIAFRSRDVCFCWNFLFLGENPVNADVMDFLGMRSSITRVLKDYREEHIFRKSAINAARPVVLFGFCDDLYYARVTERKFMEKLARSCNGLPSFIEFDEIEPLGIRNAGDAIIKGIDGYETLRNRIENSESNIVHLSCHGQMRGEDIDRGFTLRQNYHLQQDRFTAKPIGFRNNQILFLNACEMGIADPARYGSLIETFLAHGALAVLAPEAAISDKKAAKFSLQVYKEFVINRTTLAEAVFSARIARWERDDDLTGLIYALYGQSEATFSLSIGGSTQALVVPLV